MSKTGTWEDVIGPEEADAFVGRTQELASFREAILQDRPSKLIFYISGQGGAGKTELLKRYQDIARQYRFAVAESDELQGDVPAILGRFAAQLKEAGQDLEKFNEKYKRYQQLKAEIEVDVDAPQGLAAMIGRTTVRVGLGLAKEVPFLRQGAALMPKDMEDIVATQAGEYASYLARKLGNKHDEVALMREPAPILTHLFFDDLNGLADNRRFLLCFDNYEYARVYLDEWMQHLREYKPSWNIRLVIAARTEPGPTWEPLSRATRHIRLDVFNETEAEEFLDRNGVTDTARRHDILDLSGRLPVLMSWLTSAQGDTLEDESPTTDVVERFLRWVKEPSRRRLALLAALPRRFDLDVLGCLEGAEDRGTLEVDLDWLQEQPWVQQREDGWHYHEVVRHMMVRYQRTRSERGYRAHHQLLAKWYTAKQLELGLSNEEAWRNGRWQQYAVQGIYHHVLAAPDVNWSAFLDLFVRSLRYSRSLAQTLLTLATDLALEDELQVTQQDQLRLFVEQMPYVIERDYGPGLAMFAALCGAVGISSIGYAISFAHRGEAYRARGDYARALADFDRAVSLDPQYGWAIASRGETYRLMGNYPRALADFDQAMALDPKDAWAIVSRGEMYGDKGDYERALADFDEAMALDPKDAWATANRGRAYRVLGRYDEAISDFNRAMRLDSSPAWVIGERGETYRLMGEYEQALADLNVANTLDPKDAWAIASRGQTYHALNRYDEAISDLSRATEIDSSLLWAVRERGQIYREMGQFELALADFDQAIALDPKYDWAIAQRGVTYQEMGQFERALTDFDQAIALDPKYDWAIRQRGETYRQKGDYVRALADFDRAIELNPKDDWAIALRGETYRQQGEYERALADFDRAIELNPKDDWAIASRGDTYRQMGQYEQALADYDRAIGLDDTMAWAIANRGETYLLMGKYEQALADYDRAIGLDDTIAWAIANRGKTYRLMGKYEQALADFDRAIKLDPDDWWLYERALTHRVMGHEVDAGADLAAAIDGAQATETEAPENWLNKLNLALYSLASGGRTTAEDRYQAAIAAGVNKGRARDALQDLNDYLHLFPTDDAAHELRERLQRHVEERFPKGD